MKNAQPTVTAELSASDTGQYNPSSSFLGTKNPRHLRVIHALLYGPCTRTEIDAAAGASNGPEVIAQLRRLGLTIPCGRIQRRDRDGVSVWPGVYCLTDEDRQKINDWLRDKNGSEARKQ